jgi:hypothetical protein
LRNVYTHRRDLQAGGSQKVERHAARHTDVEHELIDAQRAALIALRERGEIDNVVFRRVQADLDYAEGRTVSSAALNDDAQDAS